MLFNESPEKFWDLISSRYAASPIEDRRAYETKIEKIKTLFNPEDVVLDIGCGTGTQCDDIAENVTHVTGIDISAKLLAIAERRKAERKMTNVDFLQTSLFDERFLPGSFDVVMAFHVLHFIEDIDAAIRRIHDLLKSDGLFISETVCLGEKKKMTGKVLRFMGRLGIFPRINLLTTRQLELILEGSGFSVVDKTRYGDSSKEYTLIARKI